GVPLSRVAGVVGDLVEDPLGVVVDMAGRRVEFLVKRDRWVGQPGAIRLAVRDHVGFPEGELGDGKRGCGLGDGDGHGGRGGGVAGRIAGDGGEGVGAVGGGSGIPGDGIGGGGVLGADVHAVKLELDADNTDVIGRRGRDRDGGGDGGARGWGGDGDCRRGGVIADVADVYGHGGGGGDVAGGVVGLGAQAV